MLSCFSPETIWNEHKWFSFVFLPNIPLLMSFSDVLGRFCVGWAKAGSGEGNSSVHLLAAERLRRADNSSDDLCWHNGWRGRFLPGISSISLPNSGVLWIFNQFPYFLCVCRGTVVDPWCVRPPLGTGGWREWWAGETAVGGATNQASTAEWPSWSSGSINI